MKHFLHALALILVAAPLHADDKPFIKFGWGGTIWGYGYWTIWSDDRMGYEGAFDGTYPNMPGWTWMDSTHQSGNAHFTNIGAYARARAVADAALADPALTPVVQETNCMDAGRDTFWLNGGPTPTLDVDGCYQNEKANTDAGRFFRRSGELRQDLIDAIEAGPLMLK
ncbi:MAG: hypothetical protein ABI459_12565 [Deltaproteobacteria bacterium]